MEGSGAGQGLAVGCIVVVVVVGVLSQAKVPNRASMTSCHRRNEARTHD
jgi:hypothetical protein